MSERPRSFCLIFWSAALIEKHTKICTPFSLPRIHTFIYSQSLFSYTSTNFSALFSILIIYSRVFKFFDQFVRFIFPGSTLALILSLSLSIILIKKLSICWQCQQLQRSLTSFQSTKENERCDRPEQAFS